MAGFVTVAIGGIGLIAATYILLAYSSNVAKVAGGYTAGYGKVAQTFQGR